MYIKTCINYTYVAHLNGVILCQITSHFVNNSIHNKGIMCLLYKRYYQGDKIKQYGLGEA